MKSKIIRKIVYLLIPFLLLALIAITSVFWFKAARTGVAEAVIKTELPTSLPLGEVIKLDIAVELPWGQNIQEISCKPAEGILQSKSSVESGYGRFNLHYREKYVELQFKSYRTGKLDLGKVLLKIERPFYENAPRTTTLQLDLPEINIEPLTISDRNALPLDGELYAPQQSNNRLYITAAVLILLVIAVVLIALLHYRSRKRRRKVIMMPWEIANVQLDELQREAVSGNRSLVWCVSRLTDIIRDYLSSRFSWPVNTQTTGEFFASLKRRQSPLNRAQVHYLEEFLNSADLIKFANIKPQKDDLDIAMERARELIAETASSAESDGAAQEKNHTPEVEK